MVEKLVRGGWRMEDVMNYVLRWVVLVWCLWQNGYLVMVVLSEGVKEDVSEMSGMRNLLGTSPLCGLPLHIYDKLMVFVPSFLVGHHPLGAQISDGQICNWVLLDRNQASSSHKEVLLCVCGDNGDHACRIHERTRGTPLISLQGSHEGICIQGYCTHLRKEKSE